MRQPDRGGPAGSRCGAYLIGDTQDQVEGRRLDHLQMAEVGRARAHGEEVNEMVLAHLAELVFVGFATQGWVLFALAPLFALGGIGMPALQSLTTRQVDADHQGQLQGVMASIVSLASIFGPLYFAAFYFGIKDWWPGLIWIIGVGTYVLAIPLILSMRSRRPVAVA